MFVAGPVIIVYIGKPKGSALRKLLGRMCVYVFKVSTKVHKVHDRVFSRSVHGVVG